MREIEPTTTIADQLATAEASRTACEPPSHSFPDLTVEAAYVVSALNLRRRIHGGSRIVGVKAGLTAEPIRSALGATEPDVGALHDDMAIPAGALVAASRFLQPRVELELAFILRAAPATSAPVDVLDATSHVCCAIEVVDSRVAAWNVQLVDTIADNASSAAFVLAERGEDPRSVALAALAGRVLVNGSVRGEGRSAAVLGDPLAAASWLVDSVSRLDIPLEPGHVLLTGSFVAPIPVSAGDEVLAEIDGLPPVGLTFS